MYGTRTGWMFSALHGSYSDGAKCLYMELSAYMLLSPPSASGMLSKSYPS